MKKSNKNLYAKWVDYKSLDWAKKLAQEAAKKTSKYLNKGFEELNESRGESAYVWKQGDVYMASVLECLGTKNLIADELGKSTNKGVWDVIAYDTVAATINDLVASGAKPLVLHAFWALYNDDWLLDKKRVNDFVRGWKEACDDENVTWGGGETPSLTNVISKGATVLASSAVGIIESEKRLVTDQNLKIGDKIVLIQSAGVNANGISLARNVASKLPAGYNTKMPSGKIYGEVLLARTNIYAKLVQDLLNAGVKIKYISNITGHGLRKIMRARKKFTYVIEKVFPAQEIFNFIQKHANINDYEMYQTYNMGQDYAIFISAKDVKKTQEVIAKNKFESIVAGHVATGPRQVIIKPKNITYTSETLDLR